MQVIFQWIKLKDVGRERSTCPLYHGWTSIWLAWTISCLRFRLDRRCGDVFALDNKARVILPATPTTRQPRANRPWK